MFRVTQDFIPTQLTLELDNRDFCTPRIGIARESLCRGQVTLPCDFVIVDYESDPRVPLILGRPFLRTARALIDVHGEEMILRDGNERLILNIAKTLQMSVDGNSLMTPNLDDTILRLFTDEHAIDYSSPHYGMIYDDIFSIMRPFMMILLMIHLTSNKEEKIKDSKIIDGVLDLLESNIVLPFLSVLVCKEGHYASLILEDFNPPLSLYELPFHKEVPGLGALLSFSSKNEEKVYNPRILTSKRVHTSLLPKLSHRGTKAFKVTKILKSPMEIFPCSYQEDIRFLDVLCLHFYPP
ncbi:reverse transcriptase domain-containing protein [Tanacetum coccineum]